MEQLFTDDYQALCEAFDASQIQESWSWRNTHFARELARELVDEKGELKRRALFKAIQLLEKHRYSLVEERFHDDRRLEHIGKILHLLYEDTEYLYALRRIGKPTGHVIAEMMIRHTLLLSEKTRITNGHVRQAALAALLTALRQNVGSCFATAPAILIQQEQPLRFLADIGQLLGTGRLKRTYGGVEYAAPLSASWGVGDLFKPVLLSKLGDRPLEVLARSPGLQAAFEAAGLEETSTALLKKWRVKSADPFAVINPDQIIREILLAHFELKEEEVETFQEGAVSGFVGEVLIQASPAVRGGKPRAISHYLKAYEVAKTAFKGLTDNALLKGWEFTLASLAETRADFAKWNLYISLGVKPEEPHGIGQSLYAKIQERIDKINEEIEEHQSHYDHVFAQVKSLEGRIRRASDREAEWIRAEYQIRRHELNRALSERDEAHERGRKLVNLFPFMIEFYGEKIPDYFQEVYDAEMHDVALNAYDDSPAGFRLLYKHGRANTSLWTLIHTPAEYLQHLTSFFVSTEIELSRRPEVDGLEKELTDLITTLIATIKQPEFLETSFDRLARAYNERPVAHPLDHLEQVKRKPWAYVSGGTMGTLVSCYYGNVDKPREEKQWVEREKELLAFYIDTLRGLPLSAQQRFQKKSDHSLLAFSPTHAFLLKPGWPLLRKAWESDIYSYTWIRDEWVFPQQRFLEENILNQRMLDTLIDQFLLFIPGGYRPVVKQALNSLNYAMHPTEFRQNVIKILQYEKWIGTPQHLNLISEELDRILYRSLPLFPDHQLEKRLRTTFQQIDALDPKSERALMKQFEQLTFPRYHIFTAADLRQIAQQLLQKVFGKKSAIPYHRQMIGAMRQEKYLFPEPILVGDTNWVKNAFGFTVSPGTGELEFWRFDFAGIEGRPITIWKPYLDGTIRQEWGIYTKPAEYS